MLHFITTYLSPIIRHSFIIIGFAMAIYSVYLFLLSKIHLGTILPFCIGVGFVGYGWFADELWCLIDEKPILNALILTLFVLFWLWVISVLLFFGKISTNSNQNPFITPSALIILGSRANQGVPSLALKNRLDTAFSIYQNHPTAWLVVTGGVDFGETISEADAMANYLKQNYAIDKNKILLEDKSTSTELNLKNSLPILQTKQLDKHSPLIIVTSDFHMPRTRLIAKKQGFDNFVVVGAPTPLQTRYHSWLREYFAFISGFILNEY